jgi:excisionase family DNA binding protein
MTLDDVAKFLQVHPSTIYRLVKGHRIPAFKVGSDWRFNQKSIEQWIRENEAAVENAPTLPTHKTTNGRTRHSGH